VQRCECGYLRVGTRWPRLRSPANDFRWTEMRGRFSRTRWTLLPLHRCLLLTPSLYGVYPSKHLPWASRFRRKRRSLAGLSCFVESFFNYSRLAAARQQCCFNERWILVFSKHIAWFHCWQVTSWWIKRVDRIYIQYS